MGDGEPETISVSTKKRGLTGKGTWPPELPGRNWQQHERGVGVGQEEVRRKQNTPDNNKGKIYVIVATHTEGERGVKRVRCIGRKWRSRVKLCRPVREGKGGKGRRRGVWIPSSG